MSISTAIYFVSMLLPVARVSWWCVVARNLLEVLPKAPVTKPQLTDSEEKAIWDQEESVLRELRLFLRDMLNKLARDRKFNIFSKPVDDDEVCIARIDLLW